jgi:hypothetical protein
MTNPQDFMTQFAKAIVHNVDTRPQIVQQWTEKLEAREAEIRKDELQRVGIGINDAAQIITPAAGARELNYYDFDYYRYLRNCELNGEEPLPTYKVYVESQR